MLKKSLTKPKNKHKQQKATQPAGVKFSQKSEVCQQ